MDRTMTGFHQDEFGDWVAELSCGHNQHVRHRPPFQVRPWVIDGARRAARQGTPLDCPLCDRAELPADVRLVRTSPTWTEHSMPAGLRRRHRLAAETWGRITVHDGALAFSMTSGPLLRRELVGAGATQAIPPEIDHELQPMGAVRFAIDFFAVNRGNASPVGMAE